MRRREEQALEILEGADQSLLDAAFLVRRGQAKPFQAAARKAKARLGRDGYELTLTGPWPPYNFVAESA